MSWRPVISMLLKGSAAHDEREGVGRPSKKGLVRRRPRLSQWRLASALVPQVSAPCGARFFTLKCVGSDRILIKSDRATTSFAPLCDCDCGADGYCLDFQVRKWRLRVRNVQHMRPLVCALINIVGRYCYCCYYCDRGGRLSQSMCSESEFSGEFRQHATTQMLHTPIRFNIEKFAYTTHAPGPKQTRPVRNVG